MRMLPKPLAATPTIEWMRYMNAHNQQRGKTPLAPEDIARLFAYIQLLEDRVDTASGDVATLRNKVGLGAGEDGRGVRSRRAVRAELARIERAYHRRRRAAQRAGWRGRLPYYTAHFERADRAYIATVDEMPGVFGQGRSLVTALESLAEAVHLAIAATTETGQMTTRQSKERASVAETAC